MKNTNAKLQTDYYQINCTVLHHNICHIQNYKIPDNTNIQTKIQVQKDKKYKYKNADRIISEKLNCTARHYMSDIEIQNIT